MIKTSPATYIKINMPGVLCVEKALCRAWYGSAHAGLFLYFVQGGSRNSRKTCGCIRKYKKQPGDSD